jgi:benzoyl-CoA reductase/2-hydroxyglutaryl-CoA dehydratase subunit BcrC/BadD/HgdB
MSAGTTPSVAERPRPSGLRSSATLNNLLLRYFKEAVETGRRGEPVAWVSQGFPVEILHAMGITPVCPIVSGVLRRDTKALDVAEGAGYATDICSEIKNQLGEMLSDDYGFVEIPRPTMVLTSTNYCTAFVKWGQVVERHFDVPGYCFDLPVPRPGDGGGALRYCRAQFDGLRRFLEEHAGQRCDNARLIETFMRSEEANDTWLRILGCNRHVPAPLNALDVFPHFLPLLVLRGTETAVRYYRTLEREVRDRLDRGTPAVPGERHRLLWDYLPVYARTRFFTRKFARAGASFAVAPYFLPSEPRIPFRRLQRAVVGWLVRGGVTAGLIGWSLRYFAHAYLEQNNALPLPRRVARLARLVRDYRVDGFVLHNYRTCRRFCASQYELKQALTAATGVPGVVFDADAFDTRFFSEGQITTRIEAFMETLDRGKGATNHGTAA